MISKVIKSESKVFNKSFANEHSGAKFYWEKIEMSSNEWISWFGVGHSAEKETK